jgi:prepilin-type N-terminal cleavage/methylation domain-containing protein
MDRPTGNPAHRLPHPSASGFSLLETLVAMALLGVVLLFTLSLLVQEPLVTRRLDAHREVLEVLDTVHEEIRSGMTLSLTPERLDWQTLYEPPRELQVATNLTITSVVEPVSPSALPGLFQVTLTARYLVGRRSFQHELQTRIWRPR